MRKGAEDCGKEYRKRGTLLDLSQAYRTDPPSTLALVLRLDVADFHPPRSLFLVLPSPTLILPSPSLMLPHTGVRYQHPPPPRSGLVSCLDLVHVLVFEVDIIVVRLLSVVLHVSGHTFVEPDVLGELLVGLEVPGFVGEVLEDDVSFVVLVVS